MKKIFFIVAVALLAACTKVYVKEDGTASNPRDRKECEYDAEKAVAGSGTFFSIGRPSAMGQSALLVERCLELRGYKATYQ